MFAYNGRRYVEATRQYPDHIEADLDEALGGLEAALEASAPFQEVAGWVLGAFSIKKRVPPRMATLLERHASQALALVTQHFRPPA